MLADATAVLTAIGTSLDPSALVGTLPRSEQRLVELARAYSAAARLVVMDESTGQPDPATGAAITALAQRLVS